MTKDKCFIVQVADVLVWYTLGYRTVGLTLLVPNSLIGF